LLSFPAGFNTEIPLVENWIIGQTVTYTVIRDTAVVDVPVRLNQFPLSRLPLFRFGAYGVALLSLGVGVYTLMARPSETFARLLFLICLSLVLPLTLHSQSAIFLTPTLYVLEHGIKILSGTLLYSSFLHLFLIFPESKPIIRGRERWLYGLHLINPLISLLAGVLVADTPSKSVALAQQVNSTVGLVMLLIGMVGIIHTYVTVTQATARSQIRWVVWGGVIGLLPYVLLTVLPEGITGRSILPLEATSFFITAVPVTIAIALIQHRMFDIDVLIHRTVRYGFLLLVLTGVYLLVVALFGRTVMGLTGQANEPLVVFLTTLLVSTAFFSLRKRVANIIDRIIYGTRIDPPLFLAEMSEQLSGAIHLDDVAGLLTDAAPQKIGAHSSALMVLSEDESQLEVVNGNPLALPLGNALSEWTDHKGDPVLRAVPPAWFPATALEMMEQQNVDLLLPLVVGEQLVGLWSIGARDRGGAYTSEEISTLATLGRQAAIAVQNARLVRRIEGHRQKLEREVRHRIIDLESERNRLNVILQNMADGLLVTDVSGRMLLTNPAFEEMVRQPARTLLGRPLDDALVFPSLSALIKRAVEIRGELVQTADLTRGDQVLKASASALRDRSGVVTVLRDITHEAEVDRMKSEFISTVSHELRTPLTSVLGFAKLVRRAFNQAITPALPDEETLKKAVQRVDENLEIIVTEGDRLTRLINDVLDIAKMEAGKTEWHDRKVDFRELVELAIRHASTLSKDKGLTINSEIPSDLPLLVADADRVQQVLTNLISNSIKFTDQGHITISAKVLPPGSSVSGNQLKNPRVPALLASVADTGSGIAAEDIPRLFLRFQQLGGDELTSKPQGTGLGLAICREIVSHYGGAIWAESSFGNGTTVSFMLPLPAPETAEAIATISSTPVVPLDEESERQAFILIVDDEPHIRELLRLILEETGHRTLAVATGAEAVDQARRHQPDVILLDVMMPGISGFDVLQILRADPATADIPIVILSMLENRQRGLALGADVYLTKPIERDELLEAVSMLLTPEAVE
jgi:PAS domain S-box-containing protein